MLRRMIVGRRQVLWEAMGLGEGGGVAEAPLAAAITPADRLAECQQKRRKKKQKRKALAAAKKRQQESVEAEAEDNKALRRSNQRNQRVRQDERANNINEVHASKRQPTANATVAAEKCQDATRKLMKRKQRSKDGGRSCGEQMQSPQAATVTEACAVEVAHEANNEDCGDQHRVKRSKRDQVGCRESENACVASLPHLPDVPSLERQLRFNTAKAEENVAKEQLEAAALAYARAQVRTNHFRLQIKRASQSTSIPPQPAEVVLPHDNLEQGTSAAVEEPQVARRMPVTSHLRAHTAHTDSPRSAMVGGPKHKNAPATPSAPKIGAHEGVKTSCDEASSSSVKQVVRRHLFAANSDPEVQNPTQSASNLSVVPSTIQTGCSRQPHADHHAQEDTAVCADSGMLAEAGVQARSAGGTAATLQTQKAACGDSEHQAAPNSVDQGRDWPQQAAVLDGDGQPFAAELPTRAVSPAPMLQPPLHQRQAQRKTDAHDNLQNSLKPAMASGAEVPLPQTTVSTPHAVAQDAIIIIVGHSQATPAPGSGRAGDTRVPPDACYQVQAEGGQCHAGQTCSPGLGLASPAQTTRVPQAAKGVSDIQGTAMRDDAHLLPPQYETHTDTADLSNKCQRTPRAAERVQQINNELPLDAPSMEALNRVCNAAICRGSQGAPPYALGNATNARAFARRAGGRTGGAHTASDEPQPAAAANEPVVHEADACRRLFAETAADGARWQAHASGQQDAQGQRTPNVRRLVLLPSRIPAVDDTIVLDSDSEPVLQASHAQLNNDAASRLEGGSPQSGKRRRLVKLGALQQQPHAEPAGLHPVAKAAVVLNAGAAGASMETTPDMCLMCSEPVTGNDRMVELPCGHEFHIPCISNWLCNCQNTCPQCRARITDVGSRHVPFANQREPTDEVQLQLTRTAQELRLGCMVCSRRKKSDEASFLLCDGCRTGAHFQCIGLVTATFPGGWFCDSCYISGAAHKLEPCASCHAKEYPAVECRWFHGHHDAPPYNWFHYRDVPDPVAQGNPDRRDRAPAPARRSRAARVKLVNGLGPCVRCKHQRKGANYCRLTAKHPPTML